MKQVSLSKLLIQQIMLAILAGLLVSLPITLIPSYFIIQSNVDRTLEEMQKVSQAEVNTHMATGWTEPNIKTILAHLHETMPSANFYLQKHPAFLNQDETPHPIDSSTIQRLISDVEQTNQPSTQTDLLNDKLYVAFPIKFERNCLACHQAEVQAGTIKLNQQAGAIAYIAPFSSAGVSLVTQVLFFLLFMSTFIGIALYLTNRSMHQKILNPLQNLSKRIVSLKLDNQSQAVDWQRSKHEVTEIDQIDERITEHIHVIQGIYSKLDALIVTEHETGLFHKERFNEVMSYELMRSKRYKHEFSVVVIKLLGGEVSPAETFNALPKETQISARVQALSQLVNEDSRVTDLAFRVSEDVFVIIAPETGLEGIKVMQESLVTHLKTGISASVNEGDEYQFSFNFKIGYASFPDDGQTAKNLMHEAAIRMHENVY